MEGLLSLALVRYVLIAALRDRLVLGLIILMALGVAMSVFLGSAAITEQGRFVAVYAAGSLRMINVLGLVLFAVFFIRRSFDARDIEFMLSRPIGRIRFLLSYVAAFSLLAACFGAITGLCLFVLSPEQDRGGLILWTISLVVENIIIINTALFFSMILTSAATAAFAVFGFYVLARMMSQILGIIDSGKSEMNSSVLETIMQGISMVMPRLDLMAQTSWLLYGVNDAAGLVFVLAQGTTYLAVIVLAALVDLRFRQF
ncbi:MAG: hypothetical protein IT559_05335 [Alphaproteobacteria bacterium]|nr:hypothetical protein [Alphaproteobacteria bacterium]